MKSAISILIVTEPGTLRNALEALLHSILSAHSITTLDDAMTMMSWIAAYQPDIVLLDFRLLGDEAWAILRRMKLLSPGTQRIVLTDDVLQQAVALTAAEEVLLKGIAATELVTIIKRTLSRSASAGNE